MTGVCQNSINYLREASQKILPTGDTDPLGVCGWKNQYHPFWHIFYELFHLLGLFAYGGTGEVAWHSQDQPNNLYVIWMQESGSLPSCKMRRQKQTTGPFKQLKQKSGKESIARTITVHFWSWCIHLNNFSGITRAYFFLFFFSLKFWKLCF